MITIQNLCRNYKTYIKTEGVIGSLKGFWNRQYQTREALKNINLNIESGKIVGLIGANGAGKTTLLKILSGLIEPTSGEVSVLGYTPWKRQTDYLRRISILLGQKNQLWWDIPAADSFSLLAQIYDLDEKQSKKRSLELAQLLRCEQVLHTQLRRLSLGERMKMEIIGSLLHDPEILFLDEPTIGLDVVSQATIREFLAKYVLERKPTIILTSHYMDDITRLANKLLLMSHGEIVYQGTVNEFMAKSDSKHILKFHYAEPLKEKMTLPTGIILEPHKEEYELEVTEKNMPDIINSIVKIGPIQKLKIEEADFEKTIHQFMEKESRVF